MNKIFILTLLFNSYLINVYGQTNNTWTYIINEPKKYNFKIQSRLVESTIIITPSCTTQKWKYQFKKFGVIINSKHPKVLQNGIKLNILLMVGLRTLMII